jgi:hypothetical protein
MQCIITLVYLLKKYERDKDKSKEHGTQVPNQLKILICQAYFLLCAKGKDYE